MRITIEDCMNLDAFSEARIETCARKAGNKRVRTISVFDEDNIKKGIARNGAKEQMVITHFWSLRNDINGQIEAAVGLAKKDIAALVIFLCEDGVRSVDSKLAKAAEESGLVLISIYDNGEKAYSQIIEQVLDKILYGDNYSDNILNNTIYHLLNFEKHRNFQNALKQAAISNDYQVVLMTSEFNPILTIETRKLETIDNAIAAAQKYDVTHGNTFKQVPMNDIITYWGTIEIEGEKHILLIVDNEDNYSATEIKKLAEIIELAMGMWKYTPERDSRAELIKSAVRGDVTFCYTLLDEAGLKNKQFLSVFYASGINNTESQAIIDRYKREYDFSILPLIESKDIYGMVYSSAGEGSRSTLNNACIAMFDEIKNGKKDVRILHITGLENLDNAIDGFKMINETRTDVEKVFPYKRVFSKYEMSMVYNCIILKMNSPHLRKLYIELLEPFETGISAAKGRLLLETLETFVLDAGMNSSKTAEILDIHNNTVQYRLKKINEMLGAEMTGNRIIPGLTMALAISRMEER